ncbi:competence type IV pilus ATPase ComGA [Levilactobacillus namurensis]|uniref:competence type IV pilus ATPase ComGA n=1 Tax=Levilactobacillus namurensis TaxID=380393 RepID=UPI000463D9CC|nr:competence type IV pilus ATPase ComGA [Levilactobacillus namurensis]
MLQALVTELLTAAVTQRASDIYLVPAGQAIVIRLRTTKGLHKWRTVPLATGNQLLTYFKFHADMAVSERRRPQSGALTWQQTTPPVDLRFSTVGDYAGRESLVIRVIYPYQHLAMAYLVPEQVLRLQDLATQRGLCLFAGPTGSGKTTTMYTLAQQMTTTAMVLTIEDPVEIKEPQFLQLQVNPTAGMDYVELLKVGLRHRPDVFIIGEIRDTETAQAAVRAALSGHLVLSTVHARSAGGTVTRLLELGVDRQQLRQTLTLACYQRLIPRVAQGPAVLFDVAAADDLWQASTGMQKGWHDALESAVTTRTITVATAQRYANG